jgi:hypothetical protein
MFIPTIGVAGLYTLTAPFATLLVPNISYMCVAARRLSDIIAAGGDPFALYYEPYGLTEVDYKADVANSICIVSLQAGDHNVVYVPNNRIVSYPDIGGVPYTVLGLAINLGAVPDSLDLTYVKTKITNDVAELIGITSTVQTVALSLPQLLTDSNAKIIEAARQANISTVKTDYALYLAAQALLVSAQQRIADLEAYILAHPAP